MVSTLCLLTCALAAGQTGTWQLQPQLTRGQEMVYSGSFTEEALGPGLQYHNAYKIDTTVLVLENNPQKYELAFLTIVTAKARSEPAKNGATPSSVRLEVLAMDRFGKLLPGKGIGIVPPLEGPPTIECGLFVELPRGRLDRESWWEVNEEGRTPRTWRVDGTETVGGRLCVRLIGLQQSEDWDTPRADRSAWQRRDTLWIAPQGGVTCRFERVVERREAARTAPTHRSVLRCEVLGELTYPGKLFDDRHHEILQARKFSQDAEALIREPDQHRTQLERIVAKIKQYCDAETPTPYRKAVVQVQKRIETALRGGTVADVQPDLALQQPRAVVGQRLPDFVCTDLITHDTQRLQRLVGRPLVVLFFNPATENGREVLRFGQALALRYPQGLNVLAMAVTDDSELPQKLHKEMKLPFSIFDGTGLIPLFAVDALPRLIVLDNQAIVRAAVTGWGQHIPAEISAQVQKLMPR